MILALYLRLSKEDGDMADESNSIINQRYIVRKYIDQQPELHGYQLQEYIDDGYSGKNFERPGILRLLDDIKSGKIYGMIVKDSSRFGRNHVEVGHYIEKIFPLLDIRFIAVNNCFDSSDYVGTTPGMDIVFENLMYDYFSEENSIKIKSDLFRKRSRGNFMASFAAYGYKKAPTNHNSLIIDEEAAKIVRMIFEKYIKYGVKAEVARYLNKNDIPTPQEYAIKNGIAKHWKYEHEKKFWNSSIIGRILRNPVYIGNTVFHTKEVIEAGSRKTKYLPKEDWKICEATHEAIISKAEFEQVNNQNFTIRKKASCYDPKLYCEGEKRKRGNYDSPIKGIVKCGGCRHRMTRRNRLNASYYCRHFYEVKADGCCSINIKEIDLIDIVKNAIIKHALLAADLKELLQLHRSIVKEQQCQMEKEKSILQIKIQQCEDESFTLYDQYKNDRFLQEEFIELQHKNRTQLECYQKQLDDYTELKTQDEQKTLNIITLLEGKEQITELTRDIVEQLVSEIYVYDYNRVEICFHFNDETESLLERLAD